MKMLVNIFITAIVVQLSLAAPVPPSTDNATISPAHTSYYFKRYELFDSILTKINDVTTKELIRLTSIYPAVLKDYNQWLEENQKNSAEDENKKSYQILKEHLENYISAMDNFKNDRQNCELQRKVQTTFFDVENTRAEIKNNAIDQIWKKYHNDIEDVDEEKFKAEFVNDYFKLLTISVERFLQGLDDTAKQENQDLIKWCDKFLATIDPKEKLEVFEDIQDLFEEELERETAAGQPNCRLLAQAEWGEKIVESLLIRLFVALVQPKSKQ